MGSLTVANNLPLVLVEWNDANTGSDDVVDAENITLYHKPTVVTTLGWVLQDDDLGVTLVNEYYDASYRGRTFIPRAMIVGVTSYKLSRKRKEPSK